MSIWTMMRGEGEAREKASLSGPLSLEPLEARVLLDAHLTDPESLLSHDAVAQPPAIVVDLNQEGEQVPTSPATVLPVSDSSAGSEPADAPQAILSLALPAGDSETASAKSDDAAGLNVESAEQAHVTVDRSAGSSPVNGGESVSIRPSGAEEPVVEQESSQTLPRGPPVAISSATGTILADAASVNLALGQTAVASTTYSGFPASNATDGNVLTRWSSLFSDPQWIYVDLGAVYTINQIVLRWEAYGKSYQLQVSNDASTWSNVYSTTTGDGGVDDITLSAPASGQYVRMYGTQRGTRYGYSLREFEVYGGEGATPEVTVEVIPPPAVTEGGATPLVYAFIRSLVSSNALTVNLTVGGTATYGTDYTQRGAASFSATAGTVVIPADQTTAYVLVDPTADTDVEPDETVILTVVAGTGYTVGSPAEAIGTIVSIGSLDPSFGGTGAIPTPIGPADDTGRGVVIQPDGKIVVAGYSSNGSNDDFAVVRYNTNGSLDPSFGASGKVTTAIGASDDVGYSVALQSDGKIVVAGFSNNGSNNDFAVVRYNTNGSLDPSFGTGGKVTTPIGAFDDTGQSVAIQSDGKIVVAGFSGEEADVFGSIEVLAAFAVVRYNSNGSLDPSFGTGGKVTTSVGTLDDIGYSVAIQPDGKIVVAGSTTSLENPSEPSFAVVRYNTDGSLDPSFGIGGKVTTFSSLNVGHSVAIQPDGKIVVAGFGDVISGPNFGLARYNTDGSLDSSFGGDGIAGAKAGAESEINSVAIQSDGKIVAAGWGWDGSFSVDFALARFNTDGSLDTSFGIGGSVLEPIGDNEADEGYGVAIQSDGKIVVAGHGDLDFAVARFDGGPVAAPKVTAAVTPLTVREDGAPNLLYTFTRSGPTGNALTVNFSVSGTATYGTDYTQTGAATFSATAGTATILVGQTTAQVTVNPTADTTVEPDETVLLTVTAGTGYTVGTPAAATGTIQNDDGLVNLALHTPAVASTTYSGFPASNVTDGNLLTRWSSLFSDPQWIYVDLGAIYTIDRIVLRWETAYGKSYQLQVSNDAATWSSVYSTTTGDGGVDDITLSAPVSGRYVRMYGTVRGTRYGYSLREFEVYS